MQSCHPKPLIQPLSLADVQELQEEGLPDLLTVIDFKTYNREDLYHCTGCDMVTPDNSDLDGDGLCNDCVEAGKEYAQYVDDVNWTFNASRL